MFKCIVHTIQTPNSNKCKFYNVRCRKLVLYLITEHHACTRLYRESNYKEFVKHFLTRDLLTSPFCTYSNYTVKCTIIIINIS